LFSRQFVALFKIIMPFLQPLKTFLFHTCLIFSLLKTPQKNCVLMVNFLIKQRQIKKISEGGKKI